MQIYAATKRAKSTANRVRAILHISTFKRRINQIPDAKVANYHLFKARACMRRKDFSFWWECDQHFTWHLKNNQSRLEIYFGTRLDARSREKHMISNNRSEHFDLTRNVHLQFLAFEKNKIKWSRSGCTNRVSSFSPFPGEPVNSPKHEFEQANISLAKLRVILTLSRETADKDHEYCIRGW